jgi:FMN phosphatase YigB (HAD superfamily)
MKPDPAIYRLLCERYSVTPGQCVFIDDSLPNVEGARRIGMHALHFGSIDQLLDDLAALGVRTCGAGE